MITLQDILEIENDEEILSFRCPETGYLLWPLIRNVFIRFIMSDLLYEMQFVSEERPPRPWNAYSSILKACAHNMLKGRSLKGPILIVASGSHIMRDGRYFNRLSDHFALVAHEKTVTLESLFTDWHWPFPRHNERVLFDAPILATSSLWGMYNINEKHWKAAGGLVAFVERRAQELLKWSLSERRGAFLTKLLAGLITSLPMRRCLYAKLFQKTGARVLLRQCACYGGDASIMNTIARDRGIITAEFQHGSVSSGHDAYNFANVLCGSDEYRKTLPQYFLGYGKWWTDQINVPAKKLNLGNPDRSEFLKGYLTSERRKTDILVLGDGVETERYLSMCVVLEKSVGSDYRLVFRPHPLERDKVQKQYGLKVDNVAIEWNKGIYEAFETADTVVSELSTGLFESVGLVNRIFFWDTPKAKFAFPSHPFTTFSDTNDLVAKIQEGKKHWVDLSMVNEFWAPNWKENYLTFLENVCPGILCGYYGL